MTDNNPADTYALPRHAVETDRLNMQHKALIHCFGFLIHPSIPTNGSALRVADIACGSGIWLTDVASQFAHAQCDGFDISGDQFPSAGQLAQQNLSDRVRFHVQDAAAEAGPGSDFAGQFDVVAVRLMHINLIGDQWDRAVRNVVQMLKPGGYVQWIDWDPRTARIVQVAPQPMREGMDELLSGFQAFLATRDTSATDRLPRMMEMNGIVDVNSKLYANDPDLETRRYFHGTLIEAAPHVIRKTLVEKPGSGWDEERLERAARQASLELKDERAFLRWELWCHVGRRE